MLAPIFGSHGAEALLRALQPRSAGGGRDFPSWAPAPRFRNDADLRNWIVELAQMERSVELEPGILVCASVKWGKDFVHPGESATRYALKYAAIHAVVATNPEESTAAAIAEGRSGYQYFRLDYDQEQLGPVFKEPAPHIHVVIDGEPRFAACGTPSALPIADFVDFIFRNYRHDGWARWLHETWFDRFVEDDSDDVFDLIDSAFRGTGGGSNLDFLGKPKIGAALKQMRRVLLDEKMARCTLSVDPELWDIVAA